MLDRKKKLEKRLLEYGLSYYKISNDLYLKYEPKDFVLPSEIAKRIMILYSVFYGSRNIDKISKIKDWLIKVNLWTEVSDNEKMFFERAIEDEEEIENFAWSIEKAYILAWTLNIVSEKPLPTDQITEEQFDDFVTNIPEIGTENLSEFITSQHLRELDEIYDENLFNEIATSYFRDIFINGKNIKQNLTLEQFSKDIIL